MIGIRFFGMARLKLKLKEAQVEANNVQEMLEKVAEKAGVHKKEMKQYLIYVNEVNISKLKKYKTPLKDGDEILILSPSSGG